MYKKILIIGDSGRGKTTFAKKLSEKLNIPAHDTDDYFWKVKYTEPNNKEQSVVDISKVYSTPEWIMSGSTRRLLKEGFEKADIIFYLKFRNIFFQYISIIKRSIKRKEDKLFDLLLHVTRKKYKKGYGGYDVPLDELIKNSGKQVKTFYSFKEIDNYLNSIK